MDLCLAQDMATEFIFWRSSKAMVAARILLRFSRSALDS
jgi:hypothetical protein